MKTISSRTEMRFADGTLVLTPVAKNAVRIQYAKEHKYQLPEEWLYPDLKEQKASAMQVKVSTKTEQVFIYDENDPVYQRLSRHLEDEQGKPKIKGVLFFYCPLDMAMQNKHHDEPGFWEN